MKNSILTFFFAFCPGAGQMYQGYMKRGLSLITIFCLFFAGGTVLLDALAVGCVIVWMYSFFDTFNLRAQIGAGTAPQDDYLVHINWHDKRMAQFMMDSHKLVGWGLIALGVLVAYQNILMSTLGDLMWRWGQNNPVIRALYLMMSELPEIVVCVALVICGVWLVRGPKGKKQKKQPAPEDEDFQEYVASGKSLDTEKKPGFAVPKLSHLLGRPVTPEDDASADGDEKPEDDDGRTK